MMIDENTFDTFDIPKLVDTLLKNHADKKVEKAAVYSAVKNSISIELLINSLSEIFRLPQNQIEQEIKTFGFQKLIDQYRLKNSRTDCLDGEEKDILSICSNSNVLNPFPDLFKIQSNPNFTDPVYMLGDQKETFSNLFQSVSSSFSCDPFINLYRENVIGYFEDFISNIAPQIDKEMKSCFNGSSPQYLITTGIGANEQFNHFVASINNYNRNRKLTWFILNSPRHLSSLPDDVTVENTLFLEFSRSSVTEETVKIHEFTPRNAHRIVFSNKGPLRELGKRDGNLVLELPDQVSGRYGRNKTPILLAPMYVAGMDVETFWKDINIAINAFDINNTESLPFVIAKYILLYQAQNNRNLIYLGCNDDDLLLLSDEFVQFWNEGVNKDGNDILVSRFFGLPRDSHMNIEGLLGNRKNKMAIFLLRTNMRPKTFHRLVSPMIDPINLEHEGLHFGDEEVILSFANYKRFSDLMPTIGIEISQKPSLRHAAVIGQLFADITFIYSRLNGIDPGSNPEVKSVRDRSSELLGIVAEKLRRHNFSIEEALVD